MKAAKTIMRTILLAAAAAAVMVALASCPNPVGEMLNSPGWGFLGTWTSIYTASGTPGRCYMLTVNSDGTFTSRDLGGATQITGTYTVENDTVSGSVRNLKIHYMYGAGMNDYVLARVTDGTTYESVYTTLLPYPTLVMPSDPNYFTATLQQ